MTKAECEAKLFDLMEQAKAIIREYDPKLNHFSMYFIDDYTHMHGGIDKGGGEMDGYSLDASRWPEDTDEETV